MAHHPNIAYLTKRAPTAQSYRSPGHRPRYPTFNQARAESPAYYAESRIGLMGHRLKIPCEQKERQRRSVIVAWSTAPGIPAKNDQGLKARLIIPLRRLDLQNSANHSAPFSCPTFLPRLSYTEPCNSAASRYPSNMIDAGRWGTSYSYSTEPKGQTQQQRLVGRFRFLALALALTLMLASPGSAQDTPSEPDSVQTPVVTATATPTPEGSWRDFLTGPDSVVDDSLTLFQLLQRGGPVMVPLAALALIATMMTFLYLFTVRRGVLVSDKYVNVAEALLRKGDTLGLLAVSNRHSEACAQVMRQVLDFLSTHPDVNASELRQMAQAEGTRHVAAINQRVGYLADIATLAPMLGLLGTVFGIISSFGVLSTEAANTSSLVLAGGVAQALVTTGAGLNIGIVVTVFYAYFRGRVQKITSEFESAVALLMGLLSIVPRKGSTGASTKKRFDEDEL